MKTAEEGYLLVNSKESPESRSKEIGFVLANAETLPNLKIKHQVFLMQKR